MRSVKKYIPIFLLLLLAGTCTMGQLAFTDSLQQQFTQYQLHAFQEKIFVHTDKSFYLQGEIIWFKIYTVDESFNMPADLSKVAYAEVLNDDQKPVLQAKIALQNGTGDGSFIVPSSIASGTYKLRCYTSRMKNFGADYFFEKPLTIVNTLRQRVIKVPPATRYQVDLFPEGGNLVNGLASTVAFKVTDQYGNGAAANGYIINETKDTLARMHTLHGGMGSFVLQPRRGSVYKAVVTVQDTTIIQNLPAVYEQGFVMHLQDDTATDQLQVTITGSNPFLQSPVYLFVHSRQVVKQSLAGNLQNGQAVFTVKKSSLADGMSDFTVFNADRQPVCERLYFKRPQHKLVVSAVTAADNSFATRHKVTVDIQTSNQAALPVAADMSVAVYMIDSLQPVQQEDIHTWLMLQSELVGKIESPMYYLQKDCPAEAVNNLLLTQGWRRFKWEDVLASRLPAFEFMTETEGPVITGMLTDRKTGAPRGHMAATITVPGEVFELRNAESHGDGQVYFNLNNFYSGNEVIVQAANPADSLVKIDVGHPFSDKFSRQPFAAFTLSDKYAGQLLQRSINTQAETAYLLDKKRYSFQLPAADTFAFYGKPDKQYYLDDYTRFITMEEVMKEFVAEVKVRKQRNKFQFRVVHTAFKDLFESDPLVLIDGLPVYDIDRLMALDPLRIKKIDVITHRHYLGPQVSEGIVSFKTYQGDLGGYELDPNAVIIEYEGLQRRRTFYAPVYENEEQKESRIPDLRNLLYWSPAVQTGAGGKQQVSFYTSDIQSDFAVIIQGLTASGLSGSAVVTFKVDK